MYVQSSQNFPGISIDFDKGRLAFNTTRFEQELDGYFMKMDSLETLALTAGQTEEGCHVSSFEERLAKKTFDFLPEVSKILREKNGV